VRSVSNREMSLCSHKLDVRIRCILSLKIGVIQFEFFDGLNVSRVAQWEPIQKSPELKEERFFADKFL
jgi:hypothetical protein